MRIQREYVRVILVSIQTLVNHISNAGVGRTFFLRPLNNKDHTQEMARRALCLVAWIRLFYVGRLLAI